MRHIDDGQLKPGDPCPYCKEEEINSPLQESSQWCEPNIEDQWHEGFRDVLACSECGTYVVIEKDSEIIDQAINLAAEILGIPREKLIVLTDTSADMREEWPIERLSVDVEPFTPAPHKNEEWKGSGKQRMPKQK